MTNRPPLLIAGHSHAAAMGVPTAPGSMAPYVADNNLPTAFAIGGSWPRDDAYWDLFVVEAPGRSPVLSWNGNQHQAHFLFASGRPIDFVLSSAPDLAMMRDATWVPETMLRAFFASSLAELPALLERLVQATRHPVLVVGTPPPKGDEAQLRRLLEREKFFVDAAAARRAKLATIALTPPMVMLKLWRLVQDMMRERCEAAGATFLPVPETLRTDDGFLPEHYWSHDVTHANVAFGRAFVGHIGAALSDMMRDRERTS